MGTEMVDVPGGGGGDSDGYRNGSVTLLDLSAPSTKFADSRDRLVRYSMARQTVPCRLSNAYTYKERDGLSGQTRHEPTLEMASG